MRKSDTRDPVQKLTRMIRLEPESSIVLAALDKPYKCI
jgi:hypothetical protein